MKEKKKKKKVKYIKCCWEKNDVFMVHLLSMGQWYLSLWGDLEGSILWSFLGHFPAFFVIPARLIYKTGISSVISHSFTLSDQNTCWKHNAYHT